MKETSRKWWSWVVGAILLPIIIGVIYTILALMLWEGKVAEPLRPMVSIVQRTLGGLESCWGWLTATVHTSRWWYWMSCAGLMLSIFWPCYSHLRRRLFPSYRSYTQDMFGGVLWRWSWSRRSSAGECEPNAMKAYCPKCDIEVGYQRGFVELGVGSGRAPYYECTECKKEYEYMPAEEAKKRVMKHKRQKR